MKAFVVLSGLAVFAIAAPFSSTPPDGPAAPYGKPFLPPTPSSGTNTARVPDALHGRFPANYTHPSSGVYPSGHQRPRPTGDIYPSGQYGPRPTWTGTDPFLPQGTLARKREVEEQGGSPSSISYFPNYALHPNGGNDAAPLTSIGSSSVPEFPFPTGGLRSAVGVSRGAGYGNQTSLSDQAAPTTAPTNLSGFLQNSADVAWRGVRGYALVSAPARYPPALLPSTRFLADLSGLPSSREKSPAATNMPRTPVSHKGSA